MALRPVTHVGLLLSLAWAFPAGAMPVRFEVKPGGADARITPLIFFQYCKKKASDPWDGKCGRWDIIKPEMELKGGDYCVFAQWGPKIQYRGAANFTVGDKPATFMIEPRSFNMSFCS